MSSLDECRAEYFGELCALAASGQISDAEFSELQEHVGQCANCRAAYGDYFELVHNRLPLAGPELSGSAKMAGELENSSYRERFLVRARQLGIAIPRESPRERIAGRLWFWPRIGPMQFAAAAMAALVVAVAILGYDLRQSNGRYGRLSAEMAAMSDRLNRQATPERAGLSAPVTVSKPESAPVERFRARIVNSEDLATARQDYAAAESRSRMLDQQLGAAALELKRLKAQIDEAGDSRIQLEKKLADAELAATRASSELEAIGRARAGDRAVITSQGREIGELSEKLAAQSGMLERERELLAAGRDIHDLMGARNLHVVDVLDVNSKGEDRRAFGRVFYTEGKSLIFYAFDLSDRGAAKRNASFQVWGAGGAQTATQNLGIFYADDQKQHRWVMKFEDPRVLAEIDSVFVTVEPPGGSARPTGRKFLYAYLKANPNHP